MNNNAFEKNVRVVVRAWRELWTFLRGGVPGAERKGQNVCLRERTHKTPDRGARKQQFDFEGTLAVCLAYVGQVNRHGNAVWVVSLPRSRGSAPFSAFYWPRKALRTWFQVPRAAIEVLLADYNRRANTTLTSTSSSLPALVGLLLF